jgi:prevent-host-death family protein
MERRIGTTDLRQQLTDVLARVREEGASYVVETFGRPQAILIDVDTYRQYQRFLDEREAFFDWLDETATRNAEQNTDLSDAEVLEIIASARDEVAADS